VRVGLVSDTHGELQNLREAAKKLKEKWQVDLIAHLGDECEDVAALREVWRGKIIQVPGVYCHHYRDPAIANRVVREIAGYRILFSHTKEAHKNDLPDDPKPEVLVAQRAVAIVAYGHTHIPEITKGEGILWINPGHLKNEDKKGHKPSFAVLELKPEGVTAQLVDFFSGASFTEEFVPREELHISR